MYPTRVKKRTFVWDPWAINENWIPEETAGITVTSRFPQAPKSLLSLYFFFFQLNFMLLALIFYWSECVWWSKTIKAWPVPATQADFKILSAHFITARSEQQECSLSFPDVLYWASASVKAALCSARPIPALHILAWSTSNRKSGSVWGLAQEGGAAWLVNNRLGPASHPAQLHTAVSDTKMLYWWPGKAES